MRQHCYAVVAAGLHALLTLVFLFLLSYLACFVLPLALCLLSRLLIPPHDRAQGTGLPASAIVHETFHEYA